MTSSSLLSETDLPAGRTLGVPSLADIDGDGTPDVVAGFALVDARARTNALPAPGAQRGPVDKVGVADTCVIAAVSGRSGKELWKQAAGSDGMPLQPAASDFGAAILRGKGRPFVGLGSSRWVGVDLETGRPLGQAIDFGFEPARPLQYADLDGDGDPEILATGARTGGGRFTLARLCTLDRRAPLADGGLGPLRAIRRQRGSLDALLAPLRRPGRGWTAPRS